MHMIRFLTLALIFLIALVVPKTHVSVSKASSQLSRYAPGEVIVKLKADAPELQTVDLDERLMMIARLADDRGGLSPQSIEQLVRSTSNQRVSQIITQRGLDRTFVLKLDPRVDVDRVVSELRARDDVEYAEPNYLITFGAVVPNDPDFAQQWALFNTGLTISDGDTYYTSTANADIKAHRAWEITLGSPDVIIALTDTGVDLTHPDLARNIYTNPLEIPGNGIDDDRNGFADDVNGFNVADQNGDTSDIVGHGTQMAGIIAAEINNNIGISGVCQSKLLPVRFYRRDGPNPVQFRATVADAARALLYSIAAGASIINASWRTLLSVDGVEEEQALALQDAVKATNDAGALLVCIAGNEGFNLDDSRVYPASYGLPNQITLAVSDFNDEIWHPLFFPEIVKTGFGPNTVHLAAPGVSVLTTQARGDCVLCTTDEDPTKWYTRADGSSISAALTSGVAALVKSKYPGDSAIIMKLRIVEGVEVKNNLAAYVMTSGRLSATGALTTQVNITPPTLTEVRLKGKKLTVFGSGMQQGLTVLVGPTAYDANPKSGDGTAFLARVPKSVFPSGTPVKIKLRNPDGGESQVITFTR